MKSVYRHLVNPEDYAYFHRRPVRVVTRERLQNKIQFATLRKFHIDRETRRLTSIGEDLDAYTKHYKLGTVLWPFCDTLNCVNLAELADEVRQRGLYLFDFWGFVPGSWSETEEWGEYEMLPDAAGILTGRLGDHFLGFDNGEQDGRYVGRYAPMMCPATPDRRAQYANFQRHFEKLCDAMQHNTSVLSSLHYGHYFIKDNDVTILGSECAQALPNVNLWYAFNRGAGRQYGVLWFGNASVWNRWGYKNYAESGVADSYEWGPACGTSASLMRRILYIHYTYNCDVLGYDMGWTYSEYGSLLPPRVPERAPGMGDREYEDELRKGLTPMGVLQSDALAFTEQRGYPGPMHTPVAILLDFFTGYTPPRHLYTRDVYRSWGNLPYEEGDYETHALFNLIYPGYEDAGFFRDERGFLTATPYSDMFDVLLSDADGAVLQSYSRIVLSGGFGLGAEEFDKLRSFVLAGGALNVCLGVVDTAAGRFEEDREDFLGFFGVKALGRRVAYPDGSALTYGGVRRQERAFELIDAELCGDAVILAAADDGRPAVFEVARGRGSVRVVAVPFGINRQAGYDRSATEEAGRTPNDDNQPLPMPFDLLETVKASLGDCFDGEKLVDVDAALSWSVNLRSGSELLVTVANNDSTTRRFDIRTRAGTLGRVEEVGVKNVNTGETGYYPPVFERGSEQGCGAYSIEPLDIRMFLLTVQGMGLEEKARIVVPDRTKKRYLKLDGAESIRGRITKCPTLDTYFEGVKVDARYLMDREASVLEYEAGFVKRRGLQLIVDFSGLMNHYPDLSLLENPRGRYDANMELIARTLDKAALYGATKAVIGLHRNAENHVTADAADECFAKSIASIAAMCAERGLTLYVQNGTPARHGFMMPRLVDWIDSHRLDVKIAWNIGHSLIGREDIDRIAADYGDRISALLMSAPDKDIHGQLADVHAPMHRSPFAGVIAAAAARLTDRVDFVALDAGYADADEAYRDVALLER